MSFTYPPKENPHDAPDCRLRGTNWLQYVETSDELKEAAAALPCFKALQWPDYATEIVEDTINGKPVVFNWW